MSSTKLTLLPRIPRSSQTALADLRRVKARHHNGCMVCGRLKHPDGTPHGAPPATREAGIAQAHRLAVLGVSHGLCRECAALYRRQYGGVLAA